MVPLLLFSIVAIALSVERSAFWFRVSRRQQAIVKPLLQTYRSNSPATYEQLRQHLDLPIARIFLEPLELDGPLPVCFAQHWKVRPRHNCPC